MLILILRVGQVDTDISNSVQNNLVEAFPRSSIKISKDIFPIPKEAYNPARNQYNSSIVLSKISRYAVACEADRVLGITDIDLYVPGMNFIFGEARAQPSLAS